MKIAQNSTWSVHSFNGDYLSFPESTGSCGYLVHEIPGIIQVDHAFGPKILHNFFICCTYV